MATAIDYPKVLCFGDSLTQYCFNLNDGCWGTIIASRYQRQVDVINRGFSGYTSRQAIHMLPRILSAFSSCQTVLGTQTDGNPRANTSITALLVWFGANDACTPANVAHVPVDEYGNNLDLIVDQAIASGLPVSRIILITPPEYDHAKWTELKGTEGVPADQIGRAEGRSKLYAEKCVEIAKKRGTQVADIHKAMQAESDWRSLMEDGLHFNVRGAKFVADVLIKHLDRLVANLPIIFPLSENSKRDNPKEELMNWMPRCNEKQTK
ncbi:isoamyl acetate-hydrolyzing esterase 1 homolog [Varroa destructor]|uniref:SGNH hydrolase-type esterase domain-containing protein n=1 Tax=Varroa destructor TaxID=109461 RepID=A0A7M7JQ00_VARDE|nr:isoamyl acetate-hydrolyzing esterase 1 homolog [Varroa destructor]XP_022655373.1 isoamyl acetate-hydrolyzing esterase 1 homolog [Varroa destructor]